MTGSGGPQLARKKPVVIEVMQVDRFNLEQIVRWGGGRITIVGAATLKPYLRIKTLDAIARAYLGDWVMKGTHGEFYPCAKDVFLDTYVLVTDHDNPDHQFRQVVPNVDF